MRVKFASLAFVLFSLTAVAQNEPVYDVVIRNGHVLDGAGNPSIRADVAIKDGRFVRIGIVTGRGEKEIDAAGKYVIRTVGRAATQRGLITAGRWGTATTVGGVVSVVLAPVGAFTSAYNGTIMVQCAIGTLR